MVVVRHASIAIVGRFQPFHLDHLQLVTHGLTLADKVIVGITNPDNRSLKAVATNTHRHQPSANPFTYLERLRIIDAALRCAAVATDRYEVVPFPLDDSRVWADYIPYSTPQLVRVFSAWERAKAATLQRGGYVVELLQGDPEQKISASDVRAAMAVGQPWQHWLPSGAAEVVASLPGESLQQRCACLDHER